MVPAPFIVVVDANALFPLTLRDTLLRAAAAGFYQLRWSEVILDEMERNLVSTHTMSAEKAVRLRQHMERFFPDALVTDFERLVDAMPNDPKDRHVAAAAVQAGAQVIVTANLKDFRQLPDGIEAQSPDEFLCNLFDLDPEGFVVLLREQAADLRTPPVSFEELLIRLGRIAPELAAAAGSPAEPRMRETDGTDLLWVGARHVHRPRPARSPLCCLHPAVRRQRRRICAPSRFEP